MGKFFRRILLILIFSIFIYFIYYLNSFPLKQNQILFKSCVDGDTAVFILDGKETTIRFLAIDAPEGNTQMGKEVSNYVCKALKQATQITLEVEEGITTDKYNRTLGWIYVDDSLLQKDLIKKGYAEVKYIYDDYKYVDELYKIQENAKEKKLGIWK